MKRSNNQSNHQKKTATRSLVGGDAMKAEVQRAMTQQLPSSILEDEFIRDYLTSLLSDEDSYDDVEALIDSTAMIMEDHPEDLARSLVETIAAARTAQRTAESASATAKSVAAKQTKPSSPASVTPPQSPRPHGDDLDAETSPKSHAAQRKQRRLKKEAKKQKRRGNRSNHTAQGGGRTDIRAVVSELQAQSNQDLDDLDYCSSAWKDVVDTSSAINRGVRGHGGMGVYRGLGAYRGMDVVVHNLSLSYSGQDGGRNLLQNPHFAITHRRRYGVIGPNGCGKSTLLRRIATGSVPGFPLHLSVEMGDQEVLGTEETPIERMIALQQRGGTDKRRQSLLREQGELEDALEDGTPEEAEAVAEKLSEIYEELDALEAEASVDEVEGTGAFAGLDGRAKSILKGLQFPKELLRTPGNVLSGGWRMRLALASALYSQPDILLLDGKMLRLTGFVCARAL